MSATSPSHSNVPVWPPEPIPPVGYLSRKALPIKRNDAEPLSREDVQFDLLNYIFSDSNAAFTNPTLGKTAKIPFHELYINALYSSAKCSKVLKDKMIDTPAFATELAKFSLLTNVGRINTTMAFFPEMKTALRTYHPVPSLQKTDGNAQDAPRIKNCLKAALLPHELKTIPPSTPEEILSKNQAGQKPPTSVVNLIFVLANHAAPLAIVHFDGSLNFLDIFLPKKGLSSSSRARVFLWLMYHYLEDSNGPNPWDDEFSRTNRPKAPAMRYLTDAEQSQEDIDTPEELEWGRKMTAQRNLFLQRLVASVENERKPKNPALPHFVSATPEVNPPRTRSHRQPNDAPRDDVGFLYYVPGPSHEREPPPPVRPPSPVAPVIERPRRYSYSEPRRHGEERTILEQAWHIVNTTDPLAASDDEDIDDNVRLDYKRRLDIINRAFGTSSAPPQSQPQQHQSQQHQSQQRQSQQHQSQQHRSQPHHSQPHHSQQQPQSQQHHQSHHRHRSQPSQSRQYQQPHIHDGRRRETVRREQSEQEPPEAPYEDLPFHSPGLHPHHTATSQYVPPPSRYEHPQYLPVAPRSQSRSGTQVAPLEMIASSSNNSSGPGPTPSISPISPSIRNPARLPRPRSSRK